MRYILPLLFMLLPALPWADDNTAITISDPWIRETPPGISPMAGYMELSNNGPETIVLTGVSSSDFEHVELHRTRVEGEVARMERKESLTLSSGQTVKLQPGDYHLMLFGPSRPLRAGDQVSLTFAFKDHSPQKVEAVIRAHDRGDPDHHHHH